MSEPALPSHRGHRVTIDWHLSIGAILNIFTMVLALAGTIGGGIWAAGKVSERVDQVGVQIAGVKSEVAGLRGELFAQVIQIRSEMSANADRVDKRIDNLTEARGRDDH